MAAEPLTLESLGVDLDELARRIGIAQERAQRSETECATMAGVSVERFRAWKEGHERPGVARMPKLATAVGAPVAWLMFGADPGDVIPKSEHAEAIDVARRAAALLAEAVPHIEALRRIASEINRDNVPIAGGVELASVLNDVAEEFNQNAAIPSVAHRRNHSPQIPPTFEAEQHA